MNKNYLCFSTGDHYYAIENNRVIKILPKTKLYQLPLKENAVKGILFVDQHFVAVIDIEKLCLKNCLCKEKYYIIIEINGEYMGLCASKIIDSMTINDQDWNVQDNNKFPLVYREGEREIYCFNIEMLEG